MKNKYKNFFKTYMEAYDGFSKCWYAYYSKDSNDTLNSKKQDGEKVS
jgi:hypothetical protein